MNENKRQFHANVLTYLSLIGAGFLTGVAGAHLGTEGLAILGFATTAASGLMLANAILQDIFYKLLGKYSWQSTRKQQLQGEMPFWKSYGQTRKLH